MLAVVKIPRTKTPLFEVRGDIPEKILAYLRKEYTVEVEEGEDEEYLVAQETDWYKELKASLTPGDTIRIYRENLGLSQVQLGEKLGGLSRQKISDYENGRRTIGKELAKLLSKLLKVPIDRFI